MSSKIYQYTADQNPQEAYDLLINEGYKNMPKDKKMIHIGLMDIVKKEGEEGLKKIAMIHPDRELILSTTENKTDKEAIMNCDGCNKYQNATGNPEESGKKFTFSEKNINMVIAASAIVVVFTSLAVIIRKGN
jgi:hypothetical protein